MIDTYGMFKRAVGKLGWTPEEFWGAQFYEVQLALEAFGEHVGIRDARHAAWIINGTRAAMWAENYKAIETEDLYNPDPKTKEEVEQERQELADKFPNTLD